MEHPQVLRYLWRRLFVNWLCRSRWASLVAQLVKNPPAVQETWVGFLGWEDPLEEGMATQNTPVLLAGESPWMEELGELQSMGLQRVGHN